MRLIYYCFDLDPYTYDLIDIEAYPLSLDPREPLEGCQRRPDLDHKVAAVHGNLEVWQQELEGHSPHYFAVVVGE